MIFFGTTHCEIENRSTISRDDINHIAIRSLLPLPFSYVVVFTNVAIANAARICNVILLVLG